MSNEFAENFIAPSALILPALNILRAIQLDVQNHTCVYASKIPSAINDLEELMEMMK